MGLNKEQREAVEYLEGPLLVLAGPGTGKTQLLSAKVEYILQHEQTNPENILCVTYTESGAANMRDRLSSMIGVVASDVNIYTYHALGSQIIEKYKNYAVSFNRNLDSPIDNVKQYKLLKDIQAKLPFNDILKTADISDISGTIAQAKAARLSPDDLRKVAEQNKLDGERIAEKLTPIYQTKWPPRNFDDRMSLVYQPILDIFLEFSDPQPIVGNIERVANVMAREFNDVLQAEIAKDKPSVSPPKKWLDRFVESADGVNYRLHDYIANQKLLSLADIMQQYDNALAEEGLFDFADMIEEAIRILKTDDGFRATLTERYNYILLDEFQDTNPSQFEIIKLLTDYEKPVVMAVGDDDQAICEFQGANASNLLDFQNYYNAKVITLVDNYRSIGRILDFSHQVVEQINESFAKKRNVAKKLRSMLDVFRKESGEQVASKIARHEFTTSTDEYYWVAECINDLIERGVKPSEIAVIAPQHKYIGPMLPYLKARHIDVAYERRENLLEDEKIHQIVTLAQFVYDLAEERQPGARLLEILSYDFWQVDSLAVLSAVHRSREERKPTLEYLSASDDAKLQTIAKFLADLAMQSFDAPLERFLDYLVGRIELNGYTSPFLSYYETKLTQAELFEFYENIKSLRSAVLTHTTESRPKLADFISTIHDYEDAGVAIMKTSLYSDSDSAVQLMSVHKSKGLEFRYVFMVSVDDAAWGKSTGNRNKLVLPLNLQQIRHTGGTDDEKLRLLFVAITRAKDYLIMTNSKHDFNGKNQARLKYLGEVRSEKDEKSLSPFLLGDEQTIRTHYDDFDMNTRMETEVRAWSSAYQVLTPSIENLFLQRVEKYRLNATDLTNFVDLMYAGPDAVFQKCVMQTLDEPLTPKMAYGTVVHSVLEQVTKTKITNEEAEKLFIEKATELPLTDEEIGELTEKGKYSLKIVLDKFGSILRDEKARAEVNMAPEHLHLEDVPITGKIDHIEINEADKTIDIYDYKTGKYHEGAWASHVTLYKCMLQLLFYKTLLNLSPSYRNYTVKSGHILFVTPDTEGKVYEKILDFTDEDDAMIRTLMKAVYHEIVSLDFIKNPAVNILADPDKYKIKDVREFANKLCEMYKK